MLHLTSILYLAHQVTNPELESTDMYSCGDIYELTDKHLIALIL